MTFLEICMKSCTMPASLHRRKRLISCSSGDPVLNSRRRKQTRCFECPCTHARTHTHTYPLVQNESRKRRKGGKRQESRGERCQRESCCLRLGVKILGRSRSSNSWRIPAKEERASAGEVVLGWPRLARRSLLGRPLPPPPSFVSPFLPGSLFSRP